MTCKGSVVLWSVLFTKIILVIHRSKLNIIGPNASIPCSLPITFRHDANHVKAAVTRSPAKFNIGGGDDESWCHKVGVDVMPRSGVKSADWWTMNNTCETPPHQSLTNSPCPKVIALPDTESLVVLITRRDVNVDLSSYRCAPLKASIATEVGTRTRG